MIGTKLELTLPTPTTAANVNVRTEKGKAKYKPGQNAVVWKYVVLRIDTTHSVPLNAMLGGLMYTVCLDHRLKALQGQKGAQVQIDIDMLSTADKKKWVRPPISVYFEVRWHTVSESSNSS